MFLSILVFLALVAQCHSFVTSMSRGVYYQPNRTIIFNERALKNPRLLYALCDSSNKCRLEHDREPFERPTDTCQINLQTDKIIDKIRVVPFGKDKAILVWMENADNDTYFSLTSVRFSDCSTHVARSSFDYNENLDFISQPSIASCESYYDVVFVDSKLCGDKYCKMTVDFDKNQTQEPTAWTPVDCNLDIADIISLASANDGILAIQFSGEISIINGNDRKVLKQSGSQSNTSFATLNYSTSNNFIGFCELLITTLNCSQFNNSGVRTFESTFPIDPTSAPRATYNLPDGGMLILLIKQNKNIRRILKLDAHGIQAGKLDLTIGCSNPHVPAAQFFEKNDKFCLFLACFDVGNDSKNHLEVDARCFSLSDIRAVWS